MTATSKSVQNLTVTSLNTLSTFQDNFNLAYSHGLQDIYKLENIDIKSIRKFETHQNASQGKAKKQEFEEVIHDLKLDLGVDFFDWMVPYVLDEPIQVLNFTKHIEKFLLDHDVLTLKDLQESPYIRNERPALGQAFLNEIQTKLKEYIQDKKIYKTSSINFLSLLKASIGALDRKKLYIALQPHNLHAWIPLSLTEKTELKKLPEKVKKEWQIYVKQELLNNVYLKQAIGQVFKNWGHSWLEKRAGFATQEELLEFLILRSEDEEDACSLLNWIKEEFDWNTLFESSLNLFYLSKTTKQQIEAIHRELLSYFPLCQIYEFDDLATLIQSEFCKRWEKVERNTIFYLLERSFQFTLKRNDQGKWLVSLSPMRHFAQHMHHRSRKEPD